MGGGMNGDEVREWIVHQVTRFGKRTLSEVMEGLKKTSPFSVQDNMKSFGFGEFKLKNLQKGVSYRKSTHQLINHFHCPKADLPARIKYLQACDQRMAVPVMLNTGEYLMDDKCARVTSFVQLSQGRFRGRNKFKGKSNAHKGKATTKPFHPRDMKSKADSGAPSKRAKMPEINVDVGCERPSKEASDPSKPIMWSARTRSLYVRHWRLLGGTAVLSAETSSSDNPTGPAVEVEHGFESFNEMLIYTSAKTRGLI